MKAIEALEAMRHGLKVCLYFPDCEMYQLTGPDRIEIFLVDFNGENGQPTDICSTNMFLKSFEEKEFVLYEPSQLRAH